MTQASLLGTSKTSAKKTTTAGKTSTASATLKLTATEKKLVEAYRKASTERKQQAMKLLTGDDGDVLSSLGSSVVSELIGNLLGGK